MLAIPGAYPHRSIASLRDRSHQPAAATRQAPAVITGLVEAHPYTQALLAAVPVPDGSGRMPAPPADDAEYPLQAVLR